MASMTNKPTPDSGSSGSSGGAPLNSEALMKVVGTVGYPTFAKACYDDVPAKVRLDIFRDKAEKQDTAWMRIFLEEGVFKFKHSSFPAVTNDRAGWNFHPLAMPYIDALMKAMRPGTVFMMLDPVTGRVYGKGKKVSYLTPSDEFRQMFKDITGQFLRSTEMMWPATLNRSKTEDAFIVNCGLLLTMALAMGDKQSAQSLLERAPDAWTIPILKQGSEWGTAALSCTVMGRPAGLSLLTNYGYRSSSPVFFKFDAKNLQEAGEGANPSLPHNLTPPLGIKDIKDLPAEGAITAKTLVEHLDDKILMDGTDSFLPGTLTMISRCIKHEGVLMGQPVDHQGRNEHWRGPAADSLAELGRTYLSRLNVGADQDIVDCLDEDGVLDRVKDRVVYAAVSCADRKTLERFKDRIDWPAFVGDAFPPMLLAASFDWRLAQSPDPQSEFKLVRDLCEWCIKAGHGAMLVDPGKGPECPFPDYPEQSKTLPPQASPLHVFAQYGATDAAALALSVGADIDALPVKGNLEHAGKTALDVARQYGQEKIVELFLSVKAKKAGLEALDEIRQELQRGNKP